MCITEEFKPLYPYYGQFNLSGPLYNTDHDQCRAGRPQPRPPLPHSPPHLSPPPPSSQRLAFLEVISESFRPSKTQSISLSDSTDQTDKVLWLINEMVTRFRVLIFDQETKMQHKFVPTSPTHSNYRHHWPFLYLGPSLYSVISFPPIPIVPTPTWKREIVSKKKSRFGRTRLSSCLLRGLENAFLHKAFLPKCFFTEVLPLTLFFLALEKGSYIYVYASYE